MNRLPTTFAQRYMVTTPQVADHLCLPLRISSPINLTALEVALQRVVARHAALRTTFAWAGDDLVQEVHAAFAVDFQVVPMPGASVEERMVALRAAADQRFALEQESILRVRLFPSAPDDALLLLVLHHALADGWSQWLLYDELRLLYAAFAPLSTSAAMEQATVDLPALPWSYEQAVTWYQTQLAGAEGQRLHDYWQQQLDNAPMLRLPTDHPRPLPFTMQGEIYEFRFADHLLPALTALSQQGGVTLYTLMLAGYQLLLYHYTGQTDIAVTTMTANRPQPELRSLIGMFTRPTVMRAQLTAAAPFTDFLAVVHQTVRAAMAHTGYLYMKMVEFAEPAAPGYAPLFQVAFGFQQPRRFPQGVALYDRHALPTVNYGGLTVTPVRGLSYNIGNVYELDLHIMAGSDRLLGHLYYNTTLFTEATAIRFIRQYQQLLAAIAANPTQSLVALCASL